MVLVDCVVAARCEFVLFTLKIVGDACVLKCARDLSEISPLIVLPGCYLKNLFFEGSRGRFFSTIKVQCKALGDDHAHVAIKDVAFHKF